MICPQGCPDCFSGQRFVVAVGCFCRCHVLSSAERKARKRWRLSWRDRADELKGRVNRGS